MATEEELRDVQIEKIRAEACLADEQLLSLKRDARITRRIGQGLGVGIVLALACMALFGPIKDTFEAESKLATLNSKIAKATNIALQQRLEDRQKQLNAQELRFTKDLTQLAEDLKKSNEARDDAISRAEELANREKNLANKYDLLAKNHSDNSELLKQANAAKKRAKQLELEATQLREEAVRGKQQAVDIQKRIDVRPLGKYDIFISYSQSTQSLKKRLDEIGIQYFEAKIKCEFPTLYHHKGVSTKAMLNLFDILGNTMPDYGFVAAETSEFGDDIIYICLD